MNKGLSHKKQGLNVCRLCYARTREKESQAAVNNRYCRIVNSSLQHVYNQSTEGAEFVWVSECQKGEGCKTINQFVITVLANCNTDIQFNVYLA
jgi:hypothetical protein